MSKRDEVDEKIEGLLSEESRTKTGRVLWLYDKIVELQERGVTIATIEEILNDVCFIEDKLKKGSLKTYLYRIRRKRKQTSGTPDNASRSLMTPAPSSVIAASAESSRKTTSNGLPDIEALEKKAREFMCQSEIESRRSRN